ncbi:MAG: SUMF1/EgtB/PvdO family nonheme iron enzyme [Myxococcota bacterium]
MIVLALVLLGANELAKVEHVVTAVADPMANSSGREHSFADGGKEQSPADSGGKEQPLADSGGKGQPPADSDSKKQPLAGSGGEEQLLVDIGDRKQRLAGSDGEGQWLADIGGREQQLEDSDGKEQPPADSVVEEQLLADSVGKEQSPADSGGKEQLLANSGGEEQPPTDISGKEQPPVDTGGRKHPSADAGGREQPSADAGGREQLPADDGGKEQLAADTGIRGPPPADNGGKEQPLARPKSIPLPPRQKKVFGARIAELAPARRGPEVEQRDFVESEVVQSRWAAVGLLVVSVLLVGLAVRWWMSIEVHRKWRAAMAKAAERDRVYRLAHARQLGTPYHVEPSPPLSPEVIEDAATLLARLAEERPGYDLDIELTIERTTDTGGRFDPVFLPIRQSVRLVVWVDVETGHHPDLHRVEWLLQQWRRGGLDFVRYDFEFQPGLLRENGHGLPKSIAELVARHEGAPLLILSRWVRPEDYGGRLGWLEEIMGWPNRAWLDLDPRPAEERSPEVLALRATMVGSGLSRFAFTEFGLLACARLLVSGGERTGSVGDLKPVDLDRLGPTLRLWAGCACLVPDPTWPQLEAICKRLPEFRDVLPQGGEVHRLVQWLRGYVMGRPDDAKDGLSAQLLAHGERLMLSPECRHTLKVDLRRYDAQVFRFNKKARMEYRARGLLVEQLLAADVHGDEFEMLKRDLKISMHRAMMDPREARKLLRRFEGTAVARELEGIVAEERRLQQDEGLVLHTKWASAVWEYFEGRFGNGKGAHLRDLLRWRPWSRKRVVGLLWVLGFVTVNYWIWWWTAPRCIRNNEKQAAHLVMPALSAVERVEIALAPCDDDEALEGEALMSLKCLPGSEFIMGSPPEEEGRWGDEALHRAEVLPFAIGIHEVTVAQWRAVTGTEPNNCYYGCEDDHPVHNVSWEDSVNFLNQVTDMENKRRSADAKLTRCYERKGDEWTWVQSCSGYRLPTETEWEYAARAGTATAYSFGSNSSGLDNYAWYRNNSDIRAHKVSSKIASSWGLYDMHGNLWEWVWDWYGKYPSNTSVGYSGPQGGRRRVLRGGSFDYKPKSLRSAVRSHLTPTYRGAFFGLRCARSLPATSTDPPNP